MLKQDNKDQLEFVLMRLTSQHKSTPGTDLRLVMQGSEEKKAVLMAEEATRKEKEATEARERTALAAEVANIKNKEAKEARQGAMLPEEELLRKEEEATEAEQRAQLAAKTAKVKDKVAKEARLGAMQAEEESLRIKKQRTDEINQNFGKVPWSKTIAPDNLELLDGKFTLVFSPGAQYFKISDLLRSLSVQPNLQTMGTFGIAGKGSWVKISIGNPLPFFRILYRNPAVRQVSWKKNAIHIDIN